MWDHPRVCGDNANLASGHDVITGPSPRVRGQPGLIFPSGDEFRTIPACAGTTLPLTPPSGQVPDHPRVCGDNDSVTMSIPTAPGPSPRVRGQLPYRSNIARLMRTIPACAGTTRGIQRSSHVASDHPRVCGDNGSTSARQTPTQGPSPRVRGQRQSGKGFLSTHRTIPACAGTTG